MMKKKILIAAIAAGLVSLTPAQAGTAFYNFDTDPTEQLTITGNNWEVWKSWGGNPESGGYLSITDAVNSQNSVIVFPDFDNGTIVRSFTFSCDVRMGNPTSDNPADGFSISYARAGDPILANPGDLNNFAAPGQPENGTRTGIAISFDTWSGNALPDASDIRGIIVRVDNVTVLRHGMPTQNGACGDITSLTTGPRNPDLFGDPSELCWAQLEVVLDEDAKLTVKYKGATLLNAFQTTFFPSAGQLVLAGRTGGSNANQHIDNIRITTVPAEKALITSVRGTPLGFAAALEDVGASVVDQSTVVVRFNGQAVTPSLSKQGRVTSLALNQFPPLPAGSTHTINIEFKDTQGVTVAATSTVTIPSYALIPSSAAIGTATVDKSRSGFRIRPYATEATNPNTLAWTEDQLAGVHGPNLADLTGADAQGFFNWPGVVNFDIGTGAGNFQQPNFPDSQFPGLPGSQSLDGGTGNSAMEIFTYLEFPAAGVYEMGVNSDDGFRVSSAANPRDKLAIVGGLFDGGRGATDTIFPVVIEQPGIYSFRLVWQNGGGGANLEWFTVKDGVKILVNDTQNPNAIKAYRDSSVSAAYVSAVNYGRGATDVPATANIVVEITDGASAINADSIQMTLNGTAVTPAVTKSGTRTTVTAASTTLFPAASSPTVTLAFSDPARAYDYSWRFAVPNYSVLPEEAWSAANSVDSTKPGFKVRVHQIDQVGTTTLPNRITRAEQQLAGIIGPNVADLSLAQNGVFSVPTVINWNQDFDDIGSFPNDTQIPGIPGNATPGRETDNIAAEIITYVVFPAAGYYRMGVNSDDGFKVTATDVPPANTGALVITGGGSAAGSYFALSSEYGGEPASKRITQTITGRLVYADPAEACGPLNNASAIAGNIALVDRGTCEFTVKMANCLAAGAIAVVVVNNRDVNHAEGIFPIGMAPGSLGYQDIPAVMITQPDGVKIKSGLAAGLNASITHDATPVLGQFNDGRGATDTLFDFVVPQAGTYPFRAVWFEGNGGANVEWFSVTSAGQKILLNDTTNPQALRTYQARTAAPARPRFNAVTISAGNITLSWSGTGMLEEAASITGPWAASASQANPQTVPATGTRFYRLRQ
jgi:hypothetical protein